MEIFSSKNERTKPTDKNMGFFKSKIAAFFKKLSRLKKNHEYIQESQYLVLSNRDRDLVLNLLENPPKPNARLTALMQGYDSKFVL